MKKAILGLAVVAAFTCASSIYAAVTQELELCDNSSDCIIVDQSGGITTTGTVKVAAGNVSVDGFGQITVASNVAGDVCIGTTSTTGPTCNGTGTFKINSATGNGLQDSIAPQIQDEISLDTDSSGSGTLQIEYTDTTYSNLTGGLMLSGSESTSNTPATSVLFSAYGANGTVVPATGLIGSLGPLTGVSSNSSGSFLNAYTGASASLSSKSTITFSGAGAFNTTFDIATGVPEPGSVVLLGTMLLGLTGIARKRIARRS